MRRLTLALLALALAVPASAQETVSDRQLRQRLDWAISRAENARTEVDAQLDHLIQLRADIHARITADSLAGLDTATYVIRTAIAPVADRAALWGELDWSGHYTFTAVGQQIQLCAYVWRGNDIVAQSEGVYCPRVVGVLGVPLAALTGRA